FLLPDETSYSLPPEETGCSLLPERTSYSLVIASGPEVAFVIPAILCFVQCKSKLLHILHHPSHQLLLSTPEETVATYPDHIVGAKAKAAAKRKASTKPQ
ncbi:hypothetical protein Tco_1558620, partial [Tanacetum coccineum]